MKRSDKDSFLKSIESSVVRTAYLFDFDGTICFSGEFSEDKLENPKENKAITAKMKALLAENEAVSVLTSRKSSDIVRKYLDQIGIYETIDIHAIGKTSNDSKGLYIKKQFDGFDVVFLYDDNQEYLDAAVTELADSVIEFVPVLVQDTRVIKASIMSQPNTPDISELVEYAKGFDSAEELLRAGGFSIDQLDRAAFGFDADSVTGLSVDDLNIKWKEDLDNVLYSIEKSHMTKEQWAKMVSLETPIEVSYEDGKFWIEDGHHRYYAAMVLNQPLKVTLEIKDKPVYKLRADGDYDNLVRDIWAKAHSGMDAKASVSPKDVPLLEEAKKYDTDHEFVSKQMQNEGGFKDSHVAPSFDDTAVEDRMESGGDFSLAELAQGYSTQPADYFDPKVGARYYGYNTPEGMESYRAIRSVLDGKAKSLIAYRAVPKDLPVTTIGNGEWITFSKKYAEGHGNSRFDGDYKIIELEVTPDQVWWDGNDINEWGYDNGTGDNRVTVLTREKQLFEIWKEAHGGMSAQASADKRYTLLGVTDESTTCDVCGKVDLKSTLVLQDNVEGGNIYCGSTCGRKLLGDLVKDYIKEGKGINEEVRKAVRDLWVNNPTVAKLREIDSKAVDTVNNAGNSGMSFSERLAAHDSYRYSDPFWVENNFKDNPERKEEILDSIRKEIMDKYHYSFEVTPEEFKRWGLSKYLTLSSLPVSYSVKGGIEIKASKASDELLSLFNSLGGVAGIAESGYTAELPSWHGKEPFEMTEEEYRAYQSYIEPVDHDTAQVMSDMLNELFDVVGSDPMGGYVLTSRLFDGCLTVTAWKYSQYVDSFLICCVGDTMDGEIPELWDSFLAWVRFGMSEGFENKPGLKDFSNCFMGNVLVVEAKKKHKWEEYFDDVTRPLSEKYGISFGKDKDGYFAYTHRARSGSYDSVDKIPISKLKFIGSTGSVKASVDDKTPKVTRVNPVSVLKELPDVELKEPLKIADFVAENFMEEAFVAGVCMVPVRNLVPTESLVAKDESKVAAIKATISRGDYIQPIVVEFNSVVPGAGVYTFRIIDGHHRFMAYTELKHFSVPCAIVATVDDFDVVTTCENPADLFDWNMLPDPAPDNGSPSGRTGGINDNENSELEKEPVLAKVGRVAVRTLPVPSDFVSQTFYHGGVYKESDLHSIFDEGLKGRTSQGKDMLAPIKGSVYLAKNFDYALRYALGGDVAGTDGSLVTKGESPWGLVFVVSGQSLSAVHPDEDAIGQLIWEAYDGNTSLEFVRLWAERYLTPAQLSKIKAGDLKHYAQGGKLLLDVLSSEAIDQLLDVAFAFANSGNVAVEGAYVLDRRHPELLGGPLDSIKEVMVYISDASEMPQAIAQLEEQAKTLDSKKVAANKVMASKDFSITLKCPNKVAHTFVKDLFDAISLYNTGMSRDISVVYNKSSDGNEPRSQVFFFDGDGSHRCRVKKSGDKEILLDTTSLTFFECLEPLIQILLSSISVIVDCEDSGMVEYYEDKPPVSELIMSQKSVKASGSWQIPQVLQKNYKVVGDLTNIREWKAKTILANSGGKIGEWDDVGYVLISLSSNNIIPVARGDEHQVGYDLLYHLFKKFKLPQEEYVSINATGANYLQNRNAERRAQTVQAIKKWMAMGGARLVIEDDTREGSVRIYSDQLGESGDVVPFKGTLSEDGSRIVDTFQALSDILNAIYKADRKEVLIKRFNKVSISFLQWMKSTFMLDLPSIWDDVVAGLEKVLAVPEDDYTTAEAILFSQNGIKNKIHNMLRKLENDPKNMDYRNYQRMFGDVAVAKKAFDAIDPGINVSAAEKKTQLEMGKEVEKEHKETYDFIEKYYEEHEKLPPFEEVVKHIAGDHLAEFKDYYDRLAEMEKIATKASVIDPIYVEARKYETAEEFVKAYGDVVYHGTDGVFKEFDINKDSASGVRSEAVFFSKDRNVAQGYGGNVVEAVLSLANPLEIDFEGMSTVFFDGEWRTPSGLSVRIAEINKDLANRYALDEDLVVELESYGWSSSWADKIDGAVLKNINDVGKYSELPSDSTSDNYLVSDTSLIKTKQQLIDIWNKANGMDVKASTNPVIPDDLVASLEAAGYLTTFYNDDYNEVPVEQATKLSVFSVTDWAHDKVTIKIPKRQVLTFDMVMSKLSQGSTYKNFAETFKNILDSKRRGGGLVVYPTTYGIGIFVAVGSRGGIDEIKQEVEATLAEYGIQYTTEYSDARWVFRYRISKSAANIEKLENINKSVKASATNEIEWYRGDDTQFTKFDSKRMRTGSYSTGLYLTNNKNVAAKYGKFVSTFILRPDVNYLIFQQHSIDLYKRACELYEDTTGKPLEVKAAKLDDDTKARVFWSNSEDVWNSQWQKEILKAKEMLSKELLALGVHGLFDGETLVLFDPNMAQFVSSEQVS